MDSKKKSLSENILSIAVGYVISTSINAMVIPAFASQYASHDISALAYASMVTGGIFTVISLIRSYFFRRMFERLPENWSLFNIFARKQKA